MLHKVSIIDYGMGNTWSVLSAFQFIGAKTEVVSEADELHNAECLVLPGVGSFKKAIYKIKEKSLDEAIISSCNKGTKILGICLGMQLLCLSSTEDGFNDGLSLVNGLVEKFDNEVIKKKLKVPHIGFNSVSIPAYSKLYNIDKTENDFYFVHSYRIKNLKDQRQIGVCEYGEKFVASFEIDNIFGTQFHPEKSQTNGLHLLKNFMDIKC